MQDWPVCSVSPIVLPSLRAAPAQKGVFYRKESSVVLAPWDHSIRRGWTPIGRSQGADRRTKVVHGVEHDSCPAMHVPGMSYPSSRRQTFLRSARVRLRGGT
jgi:hypothetical protein